MNTARRISFIVISVLAAIYFYKNILPYHFSPQERLTPEKLTGFFDSTHQKGVFHGQEVYSYEIPKPDKLIAQILGDTTSNKRIEVDLTNQHLYAFEGDKKVYDFLVSTGKWGRTPTGTFRIWTKLRYSGMVGGNQALGTYYNLPNVPYVMYFQNNEVPGTMGYSLHGTYWHNNFGHVMSHGCVNMRTEDAQTIYYWSQPDVRGKDSIKTTADNPSTPIGIYGEPKWE